MIGLGCDFAADDTSKARLWELEPDQRPRSRYQSRPPTQCLLQAELEPPPRQNVVIKLDDAANRSKENGEQHDWASERFPARLHRPE